MRNRCSINWSRFAEKKSERPTCLAFSDLLPNKRLSILPEGSCVRRQQTRSIYFTNRCESGKDMMRLMSDLIVYLRDLLVYKAKPEALKEDVDPETQKALAEQAELIATDRLLELIDQFAAAEGRMKWAPNKKLHFEVAIIKAIQSLGQATLDEVIEKLGDLRDGRARLPSAPKAETKIARVAEADPGYGAKKIPSNVDPAELWKEVNEKIPPQKAFLRNTAGAAHVLGIDGRHLQLGFAPSDKSLMEIMGTQANRAVIEKLVREVTGKEFSIKLSLDEKLTEKAVPRSREPKDDPLIQEAIEMFEGKLRS